MIVSRAWEEDNVQAANGGAGRRGHSARAFTVIPRTHGGRQEGVHGAMHGLPSTI